MCFKNALERLTNAKIHFNSSPGDFGYNIHISTVGMPSLTIKEGYDIDMFANCEAFSYRKEITEDDWYLHIYITKTGEEVAVL